MSEDFRSSISSVKDMSTGVPATETTATTLNAAQPPLNTSNDLGVYQHQQRFDPSDEDPVYKKVKRLGYDNSQEDDATSEQQQPQPLVLANQTTPASTGANYYPHQHGTVPPTSLILRPPPPPSATMYYRYEPSSEVMQPTSYINPGTELMFLHGTNNNRPPDEIRQFLGDSIFAPGLSFLPKNDPPRDTSTGVPVTHTAATTTTLTAAQPPLNTPNDLGVYQHQHQPWFDPSDEQLLAYLMNKNKNNENLAENKIFEVMIYDYKPEVLTDNHPQATEGKWYFFTRRRLKFHTGSDKVDRTARGGNWSSTGYQSVQNSKGVKIGSKATLIFYEGETPGGGGVKTEWRMQEYEAVENEPGDYVLCKIYKHVKRGRKSAKEDVATEPQQQRQQQQQQHRVLSNQSSSGSGMPTLAGPTPPPANTMDYPQSSLALVPPNPCVNPGTKLFPHGTNNNPPQGLDQLAFEPDNDITPLLADNDAPDLAFLSKKDSPHKAPEDDA